MIELFNNVTFLKWTVFVLVMLSIIVISNSFKLKNLLDEAIACSERLNREVVNVVQDLSAERSKYRLLSQNLETADLRIESLCKQNEELTNQLEQKELQLSQANVAAQPVRKPRRRRNNKPQSVGQA